MCPENNKQVSTYEAHNPTSRELEKFVGDFDVERDL